MLVMAARHRPSPDEKPGPPQRAHGPRGASCAGYPTTQDHRVASDGRRAYAPGWTIDRGFL